MYIEFRGLRGSLVVGVVVVVRELRNIKLLEEKKEGDKEPRLVANILNIYTIPLVGGG